MTDILIKALQLILSLSILVITHEGGHFLFAKLFKTRVEKFYLFFDPWFSIFKFKKGETEYGIGWLPLGGYVKIAGMIDESMDTEQLAKPAEPWEFRAKPAWQRLLIMLGGVLVNFISAPIIFWMILFVWGESYLPMNEAKFGLQYHEVMREAGFQDGDKILSINGEAVDTYKQIANAILFEDACTVSIEHGNGELADITMPHEFYRTILENDVQQLCAVRIPVVVDSVLKGTGAYAGGLIHGDSIVSVAGVATPTFDIFVDKLAEYADSIVPIVVVRSGANDTLSVAVDGLGKIGFYPYGPTRWMQLKHQEYSFLAACPAGISKGYELLCSYLKQLPLIFTKEGATKVGGFGTIGNLFPSSWNWEIFWFNTAFLALILAVMNVLPIPALDGGHVLFVLYEMISGRKPSDKFLEYAQVVGMVLIFGLVIYANGNDIIRAIFD